jgi:holo-[acyl-carrier protein] synthase
MTFQDIVISHDAAGKPLLLLSGRALELQHEMGIGEKFISISDEQEYAVAFVTLLKVV